MIGAARAIAFGAALTSVAHAAEPPTSGKIGGWILGVDPPGEITTIMVLDERRMIAFGFSCYGGSARSYIARNPDWKKQSDNGQPLRTYSDLICDGRLVESIYMYFDADNTAMPVSKIINMEDKPTEWRSIETDRNALTAIQSAKRYCAVTVGRQTLDLPLQSASQVISAYIDSCRDLGRW